MSDDDLFSNHPAHARDEASDDTAEPEEDTAGVDDGEVSDEPAPPVPPEVPDEPVTPDDPGPVEVPDEPVPPEVPDDPLPPEVPDDPVPPEVPDGPVPPEVPDGPVPPEVPDEPVLPEVPDEPVTPEVPDEPDDEPTWYDAVAQGLADPAPTVVDDGDVPDVEDADDELVEEDRDAHEPEGDLAHLDDGGDVDDVADGGDAGTVDGDASQVVATATSPGEDHLDVAPGEDPAPTRGAPGPVVVVTGGSGHIGSLVVDALVRDARVGQVVAVDRRAPSVPRPRVVEVTADLDAVDLPDLFASHGVAVVVHLAAILDPPSDMDDDVLHDLEVGGTQRVVDAAVAAGVTHLTVASSGAAYGYHQSNRGRRLTEDDPLRGHPDHAYARHKAEVEQLLATARRLHPEVGQLVLRLSTVLGPATANPVTRLFRAPVVLTLRDSPVPFSFVWDADVASVVTTGVVERRTGIYNVAGDGVVTMREVAELSGKRAVAVPSGWVERGLGLLARRDLAPFGPEQVDFLRHRPVLANDRLHRDFPGALTKSSREALLAWVAQDG